MKEKKITTLDDYKKVDMFLQLAKNAGFTINHGTSLNIHRQDVSLAFDTIDQGIAILRGWNSGRLELLRELSEANEKKDTRKGDADNKEPAAVKKNGKTEKAENVG